MNSRVDLVARVRGASVGAMSGAVGIAAHGAGGGGAAPTGTAVVFLLGLCAVVGTVVAAAPRLTRGPVALIATITAGQVLAHASATIAAPHAHDGAAHSTTSVPMLVAHVVAIAVTAVLVRGAEAAAVAGIAAVTRIVSAVLWSAPVATPLWVPIAVEPSVLRPSGVVGARAATRAPPASA